jgi:ACT domain-containing protein
VVELAHLDLSPRLGTGARIFLDISEFNGVVLSVVGDIPVDSEAHAVTSLI